MAPPPSNRFVSRGGEKLEAALTAFNVSVAGLVCADLGSHVGGFVDCLLQRGVKKVYSVDTSYGTLAWKLRRDPRVVVLERTNAIHVELPEAVDLVTIDVGWTKQPKILPSARRMLTELGSVITLIKPHYEAGPTQLVGGVLPHEAVPPIVDRVLAEASASGWRVVATVDSPLLGHKGNQEVLALLRPASSGTRPQEVRDYPPATDT